MSYDCVAFGWFHELLREEQVASLLEAELRLAEMLDDNAMIVHVYRDTDAENPELVGRHSRLCDFTGDRNACTAANAGHEICRFLWDDESIDAWQAAKDRDVLMDGRWSIVDLYASGSGAATQVYGRAMLQKTGSSE